MPHDGDGHYHCPRRRSIAERRRDAYEEMGPVLKEFAPMSERIENFAATTSQQRCDRFNAMTKQQMYDVIRTSEALGDWDRLDWMALALAAIGRLNGYIAEPAPCADINNNSCDCVPCEAKRESERPGLDKDRRCLRCGGKKSPLLASCGQCMADMENEISPVDVLAAERRGREIVAFGEALGIPGTFKQID